MSGRLSKTVGVAAALASFSVFGQQQLPPPLLGGPAADVPVTVQILR